MHRTPEAPTWHSEARSALRRHWIVAFESFSRKAEGFQWSTCFAISGCRRFNTHRDQARPALTRRDSLSLLEYCRLQILTCLVQPSRFMSATTRDSLLLHTLSRRVHQCVACRLAHGLSNHQKRASNRLKAGRGFKEYYEMQQRDARSIHTLHLFCR